MTLNDTFHFGKYIGCTLQAVYQGTDSIDPVVLQAYINEKLHLIYDDHEDMDAKSITVSDKTVKMPKLGRTDYTTVWTGALNGTFKSKDWEDELVGFPTLHQFQIDNADNKGEIKLYGGNPGYIQWCISQVRKFYIHSETINQLQDMITHKFLGIEFCEIGDEFYEFKPKLISEKRKFPPAIIDKNFEKFKSLYKNRGVNYAEDNIYHSDAFDSSDQDYCPACHESPCMCSDPDPG